MLARLRAGRRPLSGLTWEEYRSQINVPFWLVKMTLLRGFGGFLAFPANAEHSLNASLWSIPWEFGCYLMVAALGTFGSLRRHAIVLATAFAYAAFAIGTLSHRSTGHLVEICFFLMGAAFYVLRDRIPLSNGVAAAVVALVAVGARHAPLLELALPIALPYLIFFLAYNPRLKLQNFGRRGDVSYGVYLYGWPVQQLLVRFLEPYLNPLGLFALAMPFVVGIAYASWTLVEKPCLRLKTRRALPVPVAPEGQSER